MKKLTLLIATIFLLAMPFSGYAINPYLQGDVNDDARVNIDDVTDLINALLTGTTNSFDGYADVDGNGSVTIDDLTELIAILMGDVPENENTVSVTLPEDAPITVDEVVVVGYGIEIAPSTSLRHMREAGKRYYVTDANTISVLTRDGKLVYDSYVSLDANNRERTVAVDAMETAYTLLVPMFPVDFDATPDYVYAELKRMLSGLPETQALADAIDRSIVNRGYFEIDDVETEYRAASDKIIDKLGLRDNYLSGSTPADASLRMPSEPYILYGEYGHWGFHLRLNSSQWTPPEGVGDDNENGLGTWHCDMTAYNWNRFAYTSWNRGYIDENGVVRFYSEDPVELMKHILKPQRVATFMGTFTDPVTDPFSSKSWERISDFIDDSWNLIFDPNFGINDMTWDMTKVKFDMDFTSPNDVVIFDGPDNDYMLVYNVLKTLLEPLVKKICKNISKAARLENENGNAEESLDFFTIMCLELMKDPTFWPQFKYIWESDKSNSAKASEIIEKTLPKFKEILTEYAKEKIDKWNKDLCKEVFGYTTINQLETAYHDVTKNLMEYLKIVEFWGDMEIGLLGLTLEGSGYYDMDLDFQDAPINTKEFTVGENGVKFTMVEVKGGSFLMGASMKQINDAHEDEYPLHNVTLSDYYIGQTEVTQELWKAVMGSVPGTYKNAKYPVGGVSWLECQQFIAKLNEMTGETFRLPTEAEWEYAARGGRGAKERQYAGSDALDNVAWYHDNSGLHPHTVATDKFPNQLALYDMSGNAMEWCSNWYGAYSSDAQTNPTGPATGDQRVCRGGGWGYGSDLCRVSCRNSFAPSNSMNENLGLRLVWEPKNNDEIFTVNGVTFKMIAVEGGTFMMGAADDDADATPLEKPAHQVTLSGYSIGETEVTQALWVAVMGTNPSTFGNRMNYPVEHLDWNNCQEFISKLNQITGRVFRLPTEAEWEFAARGGNKSMGYKYAGSNNINEVAWWGYFDGGNSGWTTHPVAQLLPNELGLYDMSGNVYEWCQDWIGYYTSSEQINPTGPESGPVHVYRGGCWYSNRMGGCRVSFRTTDNPSYWDGTLGLRLAMSDNSQDEHEWVDLGLPSGTLWATCNVGASAPEEYGDYFAWGETAPKDYYDWSTYKWGNDSHDNTLTKYCTKSTYGYNGFVDNMTELESNDDAAYVNWGSLWRMPTIGQQDELRVNCTWQWTQKNGVNGQLVTGPNGNTLFLPAAGYNSCGSLHLLGSSFFYWSRTLYSDRPCYAYYLGFEGGIYQGKNYRSYGRSVRAVRVSQN